jgi:pimeloyl-ACP methyl ester carboxylesterase
MGKIGGAALLGYLVQCLHANRPHNLSKVILLSPAGFFAHLSPLFSFAVKYISRPIFSLLPSHTPFPFKSTATHAIMARLLQDLKNLPAFAQLINYIGCFLIGGAKQQDFPFAYVPWSKYPLGVTSVMIYKHGLQCIMKDVFGAFDFGSEELNMKAYGVKTPPLYSDKYSKINIPVHFVAGGHDKLVPERDVWRHYELLRKEKPQLATYAFFKKAGHLEFTIGIDSEVNNHILQNLKCGRNRDVKRKVETIEKKIVKNEGDIMSKEHFGYKKVAWDLKPYAKL